MPGQSRTFARYQVVAGYICLLASIGLYVFQGIGWRPFGVQPDFGPLPLALFLVSGWVLFQLNIVRLLRGLIDVADQRADTEGDDDDGADVE